ncbi:uncharacterized protein LOC135813411 [Sycon ciliatum]|uniref:uncharacterized protein LOC135813411 n=1 Tax=Sycon ciliatum TaxID=27933 RepID=UPI0031F68198
MDRNPAFSEAYCAKIAQYIDDGYDTKLTHSQLQMPSQRAWYLPHFGVINPNKPGKLRLVFDAAAPSHGVSLNDALLPGPDYLNPLTSVLFKFRQHRVGFGGDIRQMFHQVHIRPDDQPAQRFLRKDLELHVFEDASESAFAAAAYFRLSLPDDSTRVAFVFGKSRVAPLKPISIPRLELQAALMASRMADTVRKEHDLPIDRIVL